MADARKKRDSAKDVVNYIGYNKMYQDGICEVEEGMFSSSIAFDDTSYHSVRDEQQKAMFSAITRLYDQFGADTLVQMSVINTPLLKEEVGHRKFFDPERQANDAARNDAQVFNNILNDKVKEGVSNIRRNRYLTYSVTADTAEDAARQVYTAICERYAAQFLPPAVYDVSESTVSVDGGTLKLTAKRLSDAGFTAVFPNISNSRVREDSDTGNPWVPAGSHTLAGISCSITEGETTPPAPYTEGTLITDMASIAKYVKDPEIREILKRKDDGKKGEHGGIGTTATRSSIIEGLKTRGYLEERKGKVRATDKAKAFYALLPPEIRGADVTARWWLIQQDIADGKADVNALQDSVIEVFNHHRETAYVGASIAGAGKTVVGKCPRCGKDVIKTGSIYACSSIKNEKQEDGTWKEVAGCGFKLFGFCTKKFTEKQAASLLDGKAVSLRGCKSKAGKQRHRELRFPAAAGRDRFPRHQ